MPILALCACLCRKETFSRGTDFILIFVLAIVWTFWAPFANADELSGSQEYVIKPGDSLLITIAGRESEPTAQVVVRPDGMITYPLIGELKASGLTVKQLSDAVNSRLSALEYYNEPQVTVQLKSTRQETIYVSGEVNDPGAKSFPEPVDLMRALAAAGWFKDTADLSSARIIRNREHGYSEIVEVDLGKLLGGETAPRGGSQGG